MPNSSRSRRRIATLSGPVGDLGHKAQLDDIKIHHGRDGGAALVLMHGWPDYWLEWYRYLGPLAEHLDVTVADIRGFGD